MKRPFRWRTYAILSIAFLALLTPSPAQAATKRKYEVSHKNGRMATVVTSADKEKISVSIYRQGQAAHHYRTYTQVASTVVQIGRHDLFTHHIDAKSIVADDFSFKLEDVSGAARQRRSDILAIGKRLEEDMRILRSVRGYNPAADVILAELAYVVLTYDSSIMDGEALTSFSVRESARVITRGQRRGTRFLKASAGSVLQCKLDECKSTCETHYSECQADQNVGDKTACHNNRASCSNNCYRSCGPAPEEGSSY